MNEKKQQKKIVQTRKKVQVKSVKLDEVRHVATKTGNVVKKSGDKTILVECTHTKIHPLYEKKYKVGRRYLVDDPGNRAKVGEEVIIKGCKPVSKRKRWELVNEVKS